MAAPGETAAPPLVERELERQQLLDLFRPGDVEQGTDATATGANRTDVGRAHAGRANAAVIVGAAGIGKSRLMHECVPALEELGYHPLRVVATPVLREVPFGAFRQLLPAFADDIGSWLRVLHDGTDRLQALAGDRRPLLVVDDLQELDAGSVALVLHALDAASVHLVGTLRSEPRFRPHVVDMLKRFWGDRLATRLDLPPLTRAGIATLASCVLGAPIDALSVERLWSWTGGNPFLLQLVLADDVTTETFDERSGLWQIDTGAAGPTLVTAVEQTLRDIPDDVLHVARLLAEADTLSLDVLIEAAGPDAVAEAEQRGLVTAIDGARGVSYRLTHPLYGNALVAQETDRRRRDLRHALATAMITIAGSVEAVDAADRVLLALWYVDQEDLGPDAQFVLLDAARQSMRSWNHRMAVRFADRVWQADGSIDAGLILCKAYDGLGMDDEACAVATYLLDHARTDAERLVATIQLAGAETRRTGSIDRSREILEESMTRLDDHRWAAGLQIYLANLLMHEGQLEEALAITVPIAAADADGFGVEAVAVDAPIAVAQGRIEDALVRARRVRAAQRGGRRLMAAQPWLVSLIIGLAELEDGQLDAARHTLRAVYDDGVARGDVEIVGWSALQLGRAALLEGIDHGDAARLFREAVSALGELTGPRYVAWALGGLTGTLAVLGDLEGARAAAHEFDHPPPHSVRFYHAEAQRQRAWLEVLEGDRGRALVILDDAARAAHDTTEWVVEAACLHDLARVGFAGAAEGTVRDGDPVARAVAGLRLKARMQAVRARPGMGSALVTARGDHVDALAGARAGPGDAGTFEETATAFGALGARELAAEAWAGAAAVHRRAGDERGAARATLRARALLVGRQAPPTPLLEGLPTVRMTERQQTVARLAAAGVTRQDMAESCYVSLRTIDRHLDDVFGVLGIRSKDDLAPALADYDRVHGITRTADAALLLAGLAGDGDVGRPRGVPRLTHRELEVTDGRVTIGPVHEPKRRGDGG